MAKQWTDLDTWMHDNADERIFRLWKYKKVFTPAEVAAKYSDESVYEDDICTYVWIEEVIEFENGKILFGFKDATQAMMYEHGETTYKPPIEYMFDGEFSLAYYPDDYEKLENELGYADYDEKDEENVDNE